jgi:hypothetical protein
MREASRMDEFALSIRQARPSDAADVARVYIASWQDTYPSVIPHVFLSGMTLKGQTQRWETIIKRRAPDIVLVAESPRHGIVGMCSLGPARDRGLGFDGEVYMLYIDPQFYGQGAVRERHFSSCVIWAHARNNARFFYEAMGGKLIAERVMHVMGENMPEAGFGWRDLAPVTSTAR